MRRLAIGLTIAGLGALFSSATDIHSADLSIASRYITLHPSSPEGRYVDGFTRIGTPAGRYVDGLIRIGSPEGRYTREIARTGSPLGRYVREIVRVESPAGRYVAHHSDIARVPSPEGRYVHAGQTTRPILDASLGSAETHGDRTA